MILDFQQFVATETPYWRELETLLDSKENRGISGMSLDEAKRFYYLYQRASSDLARLSGYSLDPGVRALLEALVARAYADVHEKRQRLDRNLSVARGLAVFAQTFRRNRWAFGLAVAVTVVGSLLGAFLLYADKDAKNILIPFGNLHGDPAERVAHEESAREDRVSGRAASFSSMLMTHNIRVSIFAAALGMSFGVGTLLILFGNGLILGAVVFDYIRAGQGVFVAGWLLPHGVIEIPAILIAGQAGVILGRALVGHGDATPVRMRLRNVRNDILTLICGASALLVWAGIVEAFLSQYHKPFVPYSLKIGFGIVELAILCWYLGFAGRSPRRA